MSEEEELKLKIIEALKHPEAEEGLYFRNFFHLHEEDERPRIEADETDILSALNELVRDGRVRLDNSGGEAIFILAE